MTTTPNPSAEQILAAELMKLWGAPAGTEQKITESVEAEAEETTD